jgi:hypothetical protein
VEVAAPAHPGNFESETGIEDENKDESFPRMPLPFCFADDFLRRRIEHASPTPATSGDDRDCSDLGYPDAQFGSGIHGDGFHGRGGGSELELERGDRHAAAQREHGHVHGTD